MNTASFYTLFKNILFGFTFLSTIAFAAQSHESNNEQEYIAQLDKILKQIPREVINEKILLQERANIALGLLKAIKGESDSKEDKEAHYFKPREPRPLAEEKKKLTVQQRVAQDYIGEIPPQVHDIIGYFTNYETFKANDWHIYNRLLLYGKPGTGKSHLMETIARELQLPYLKFTASFFTDKYIGESSRKIRKAFDEAKKINKPILIFIDELDALATKRKDNTHDEKRATLITLLTELQDLQKDPHIFVVCATNDKSALDPAMLDRFGGSICEIKELNLNHRALLIKKYFDDRKAGVPMPFAERVAYILQTSFSNRDLEYIVETSLLKMRLAQLAKVPLNERCAICPYMRETIDATGKQAYFGWRESWSNGI